MVVFPLKYDWVESFNEDFAKIEINRKYGFIDKTSKEVKM